MKKLTLTELPYKYGDLEPVISAKIIELHHSKHHKAYVDGANTALDKLEKARKGELQIDYKSVLRDLSFHMNGHVLHELFWYDLQKPSEKNTPGGKIADAIDREFGSFEAFKKEFSETAKSVEGSGWAVLYKDSDGQLVVLSIEKHNLMHVAGLRPILALDVWEHAYYLDYLNNRGAYVENFWKVVNWDYVEKVYSR